MARYKVIVPLLNVRETPPNEFTDKNILTTVCEGLILDLEDVTEVPNPALGKWYKDAHGQHYSEKGLQLLDNLPATGNFISQSFAFKPTINHWWITDYGIDKIWQTTRGAGVKIAIIDTGLNFNHSNIKNKSNISYLSILNDSEKSNDCLDSNGHGSYCTSIIAAQGPDVFGVSPESDLLIIKATNDGDLSCAALAKAINKSIEMKADIISISYSFFKSDTGFNLLEDSVKKAVDNNILIIASTGNSGGNSKIYETYPASFETCIGVGSSNRDKDLWLKTTLNDYIDILAPGSNIGVFGLDSLKTDSVSGTSFSTPYVASLCALILSSLNIKDTQSLIEQIRTKSTDKTKIKNQINNFYKNNKLKIDDLGIISPLDTFNNLKP